MRFEGKGSVWMGVAYGVWRRKGGRRGSLTIRGFPSQVRDITSVIVLVVGR